MKKAYILFYRSLIALLKEIGKFLKRKFPVNGIFKVRNIFQIIALYIFFNILIIITYCDLPSWGNKNAITIGLYGTQQRFGEGVLYDRLKLAAEKNGWNVIGVCLTEELTQNAITKHLCYTALSFVNYIYKPKFNFYTTHHVNILPIGYNIMYINLPNEYIINDNGDFKGVFKHIANYDAYVDIHSVINKTNPLLSQALKINNNEKAPIIPLYFAHHYVPYSPAKRQQILVVGSLWGANRESLRVKTALKWLAAEDLLLAYGIKSAFSTLGKGYKGRIEEYSGSQKTDNLFDIQKEYGISLVLHSLEHLIENIPTNRIAEAIAAGNIVISDNNGFVQKIFGSNVLYINALQQSEGIYREIHRHVQWIRNNPQEVEKKARAAYDILMSQFTMEETLKKLVIVVDKLQHK